MLIIICPLFYNLVFFNVLGWIQFKLYHTKWTKMFVSKKKEIILLKVYKTFFTDFKIFRKLISDPGPQKQATFFLKAECIWFSLIYGLLGYIWIWYLKLFWLTTIITSCRIWTWNSKLYRYQTWVDNSVINKWVKFVDMFSSIFISIFAASTHKNIVLIYLRWKTYIFMEHDLNLIYLHATYDGYFQTISSP